MADLIGLIDASISLAGRLRKVVKSYADANETAAMMRLFDIQLGTVRLDLLRSAIIRNKIKFEQQQLNDCVCKALEGLKADLTKATAYIESWEPKNIIRRLWWVVWTESEVTELFDNVQGHMAVLRETVGMAASEPNLESLKNFTILDIYKVLDNAQLGCLAKADWVGPNDINSGAHRKQLHVFIESGRGAHDGERELEKKARLAKRTAERLWWSCVGESVYQTGVLPCIGSHGHRTVFLLPDNSKDAQSLRELIQSNQKQGCRILVPLEARLAFALQLAEAVLKIHVAGLAHCNIRSDTVLFLAPNEEGSIVAAADGHGTMNAFRGAPKRRMSVKKGLNRVSTFLSGGTSEPSPSKGPSKDTPKRQTSRSRAKVIRQGSFLKLKKSDSGDEDLGDTDDQTGPVKDNLGQAETATNTNISGTNPRAGRVPPGFGSLYLIQWFGVEYRGGYPKRTENRDKNIYRHPQQQGTSPKVQYNMGHDIYSLGVCLIEIGLWESFVFTQKDTEKDEETVKKVYGRLGEELKKKSPEDVKKRLVKMAEDELPGAMGKSYTQLVKRCLTCLDSPGEGKENHRYSKFNAAMDCREFRKSVRLFLTDFNKDFHAGLGNPSPSYQNQV